MIHDRQMEEADRSQEKINVNIFRYKFTQEFMDELYQFSKIHQYDDRHGFKEAWTEWVEINWDTINTEIRRINELGYTGDIIEKMFKSARYYFRKKSTVTPVKQSPRRNYITANKDLLDAMDRHIIQNINTEKYKPSQGFLDFCNSNTDLLRIEISHLLENNITNSNDIQSKFKKTYKNRYFIITKTTA